MIWLCYIFAFLIGGAVGSFLNVLSARTIARKSILLPRSFCDTCTKPIYRHDMIPMLSYFLLRARCRFCKMKISWEHPVVEATTAVLFVVAALLASSAAELVLFWFAISILVTLFLTDIRAMILPDQITLPGIALFVVFDIFILDRDLVSLLLAVLVGGLFFLIQYAVSRGKWVGSGDIRLGVLMGTILGAWQLVGWALMVSYVIGALVTIPLLLMKKKGWKSELPLGAFLVAGTLLVLFFWPFLGEYVVGW